MTPDLIVIGGGSAGAACAARLAEGGKRVLLVEAGKSDADIRSKVPALMSGIVHTPEFDWMYKAEPDGSVGGRADVWPAGKRLGGGSAINGMMFIRGHKWDYDQWAELGATGWDYASVLPYFRRMEDNERGADEWRGRGGPIAFRRRKPVRQRLSSRSSPSPAARPWLRRPGTALGLVERAPRSRQRLWLAQHLETHRAGHRRHFDEADFDTVRELISLAAALSEERSRRFVIYSNRQPAMTPG